MVVNLLDNAVRYSPHGGTIDVEVSVPETETVRLSVTDQGIGIAPEHLPHIFDPYYQAHTNQHFGGLGLGLFITWQIVSLHGGRVETEFPPDGGTRFVVSVPRGVSAVDAGLSGGMVR